MIVSLIVAMSKNRVIGRDGRLPWNISEDLKRFKRLTMGHHLLMGRKTYESIGRPLPGRKSVVITRNPEYVAQGVLIAHDLHQALRMAERDDEVFVIGGAKIYELALPRADRLYLTLVHAEVDGDTCFPKLKSHEWTLVEDSGVMRSSSDSLAHSFQVRDRRDGNTN